MTGQHVVEELRQIGQKHPSLLRLGTSTSMPVLGLTEHLLVNQNLALLTPSATHGSGKSSMSDAKAR
jgi:hypothetical protein